MLWRKKKLNSNETDKLASYWAEQNKACSLYNEQAHMGMFNQECKNMRGKRILDIGCGQGKIWDYFIQRGATTWGVDISWESVACIKDRNQQAVVGDSRYLPFKDNSFDIVFSLGVVEHFKETEKAIKEHFRVCQGGGKVIVVVPNLLSPYSFSYLYHFFRGLYGMGLAVFGKRYNKKMLHSMLLYAGLENIDIKVYYGSVFLRLLSVGFIPELAKIIDKSWFTRNFGHLLWGVGLKPKEL